MFDPNLSDRYKLYTVAPCSMFRSIILIPLSNLLVLTDCFVGIHHVYIILSSSSSTDSYPAVIKRIAGASFSPLKSESSYYLI